MTYTEEGAGGLGFLGLCLMVAVLGMEGAQNVVGVVLLVPLAVSLRSGARPYAPAMLIAGGLAVTVWASTSGAFFPWALVLTGVVRLARVQSWARPLVAAAAVATAATTPGLVLSALHPYWGLVNPERQDPGRPQVALIVVSSLIGVAAMVWILGTLAQRSRAAGDASLARSLWVAAVLLAVARAAELAIVLAFARKGQAVPYDGEWGRLARRGWPVVPGILAIWLVRPLYRARSATQFRGAVGPGRAARAQRAAAREAAVDKVREDAGR